MPATFPSYAHFKATDVTVGTSLTTVFDSSTLGPALHGRGLVSMMIDNEADGQALSAFNIDIKPHPDSAWFTLVSATGWDSASAFMLYATADPVGLSSGSASMVVLDLHAAYQFRVQAQVASSTTIVNLYGQIIER